jgi:hypothetical protein
MPGSLTPVILSRIKARPILFGGSPEAAEVWRPQHRVLVQDGRCVWEGREKKTVPLPPLAEIPVTCGVMASLMWKTSWPQ